MTPDANDVPTIQSDPTLGAEFKNYAGACTFGWEFNLTRAPFDNFKVREAFAYAFDREGFIRDVTKDTNVKTLTWIPPGYPGYDDKETRYDFDLEKAKAALSEAGFADGAGFPEVKLTYASNNPANQARSEYLVQMYKKNLNVDLTLDPVESTTLTALRKDPKTFPQLVRGGWCADYPDQQNWLSIFWHSRSEFAKNISYKDTKADELMDQADVELDSAKRNDLYDQAQKQVISTLPIIIYGNSKNNYLIKPWVKGLDFTPQDSDEPGLITGLAGVTLGQ